MSVTKKRQIVKVLPDFTYTTTVAKDIFEDIAGMYNFGVTIYTSATHTIKYDIATAPLRSGANSYLYTIITGTQVIGTASGIANTHFISGNNNAHLKITFSNSASLTVAAGGIKVYVTYSER